MLDVSSGDVMLMFKITSFGSDGNSKPLWVQLPDVGAGWISPTEAKTCRSSPSEWFYDICAVKLQLQDDFQCNCGILEPQFHPRTL